MKKTTVALAAAALFVAGNIAAVSTANAAVKCSGANSCKGMSACKTASSACKGMNSCKGKGFTEAADAAACTKAGGKVM